MIVDETIVRKVLDVYQSYPSKSTASIANTVNQYFSKSESNDRVQAIASTLFTDNEEGLGFSLRKYYPLILFYTHPAARGGLKIILDYRNKGMLQLYKDFCKDFGIPSHLKKFGSSKFKLFRIIPEIPCWKISEVREGSASSPFGNDILIEFLLSYCSQKLPEFTKIYLPRYLSDSLVNQMIQTFENKGYLLLNKTKNILSIDKACSKIRI